MKRLIQSISILGLGGALLSLAPQVQASTPKPTAEAGGGKRVLDISRHAAPNGEVFTVEKSEEDGKDVLRYRRANGQVLSEQEMRAFEAAHPEPVLDEALAQQALAAAPGQPLEVVVWLRNRPGAKHLREALQTREREMQGLEERARQIQRSVRPDRPMGPQEEKQFLEELKRSNTKLSAQQNAELRGIGERLEKLKKEAREEGQRRTKAAVAEDRRNLEAKLGLLGGRIRGHVETQNAFEITVPAGRLAELAKDPAVARIISIPEPELELDTQAASLGLTSGFWSDGRTGGIWDLGVLDTGVRQDHPAFSHLTFMSNVGNLDANGHGTAVAGIVASNDVTYRGLAYGMQAMLVGTNSQSSLFSHADWMVNYSAGDDAEVINLSSGYGTANDTDYSTFDQFFDGLIDDNSVLVTKSAGNNGDGTTTITHPAPAYNLMAVANVYDNNTSSRSDDFIWGSSSRGPTLNGRKKPDISAPGHLTRTTESAWAGAAADFTDFTGTSSAAPHVAGGAILLTDLRSNDTPHANKAILINTADAISDNGTSGNTADDVPVNGSQWNKTYGWGYLDLWEAWFNGLDVFTSTVDDGVTPVGPDFKLYTGTMYTGEKATLVWNRHLSYNGASSPTVVENLSDLDLLAYNTTGGLIAASTAVADNVEQVAVNVSGAVVLKVDYFGSLDPDLSVETFSLATEEGFVAATAPSFSFVASPGSVFCGTNFTLSTTVRNNGSVPSFNNNVRVTLPAGMTLVAGANPQNVGTLAANGTATASWTVSSVACTASVARTVTFSNSSASYGESFTGSVNHAITFVP